MKDVVKQRMKSFWEVNFLSLPLQIAQEVARNARKLEFVGLGLSLVSLLISIAIFSYFRCASQYFKRKVHQQPNFISQVNGTISIVCTYLLYELR